MPTKRFDNLDKDKQKNIIGAARREFADNGFHDASLNGIIKNAGISKGSLYYYFEDKTDLYLTVLSEVYGELLGTTVIDPEVLTAENFWNVFSELTLDYISHTKDNPDIVMLTRDLYRMGDSPHASGAIADFFEKIQAVYVSFFSRGLELGVVREDVPLDLLMSILSHMGEGLDLWVFERWEEFSSEQLDKYSQLYAEMVRKIASPEQGEGGSRK